MKIEINYTFYTDGDYSLTNPEKFGCIGRYVETDYGYFDYVGAMDFEKEESWRCKNDAKSFLEKLLCNGIHISYTHYWLLQSFYNIIDELIKFITHNDTGTLCKEISGNQNGTKIMVTIMQ